jgi:hypothetical protein
MKVVTPLRVGVAGSLCFFSGLTWMLIWHHSVHHLVRLNETGIIIVDYYAPVLPRILVLAGLVFLLISVVWKAVARVRRRIS